MDIYVGCHLSISKGYKHMATEALSLGANTFAFFTRNPRGGNARELDIDDMNALMDMVHEHEFGPLVAHAPYTYNLCSKNVKVRDFALQAMKEDLERMELMGGNYYNFHPGSHTGQGSDKGIELISSGLNYVMKPNMNTWVLLETMAGKGTEVGRSFEEIASIINSVDNNDHLGVCLDTCHVSDAGYDISSNLDEVLDAFDDIIGLDRLKALHLNDSKNPVGAHKDRHEKIGQGYLGIDTFEAVVSNPRINHLPMIIETPNDLDGYKEEIKLLRQLASKY